MQDKDLSIKNNKIKKQKDSLMNVASKNVDVIDKIINDIQKLTAAQVVILVERLKKVFDITDVSSLLAGAGISSQAQSVIDVIHTYDVYLEDVGSQKFDVVKLLGEMKSLKLSESLAKINQPLPFILEEDVDENIAKDIKTKFEKVGAVILIKERD